MATGDPPWDGLRTTVVLYGAAPFDPYPQPQPFVPFAPPVFVPEVDVAEMARRIAEAMQTKPGKVDPPPSEAHRELDAIKALVTALESLDALVKSLAMQLTAEEKARVLRYMVDRYGKLPVFGVVEESDGKR
jgi:hypothetical protein